MRKRFRKFTVNLSEPQFIWLAKEAEIFGITIGDMIRRLVDGLREGK